MKQELLLFLCIILAQALYASESEKNQSIPVSTSFETMTTFTHTSIDGRETPEEFEARAKLEEQYQKHEDFYFAKIRHDERCHRKNRTSSQAMIIQISNQVDAEEIVDPFDLARSFSYDSSCPVIGHETGVFSRRNRNKISDLEVQLPQKNIIKPAKGLSRFFDCISFGLCNKVYVTSGKES